MKQEIRIIGEKGKKGRYLILLNSQRIWLCGVDFLIMFSMALAWRFRADHLVHRSELMNDLTARYVWRLKRNINKRSIIDTDKLIKSKFSRGSRWGGAVASYFLDVDYIIIDQVAFDFEDHRLMDFFDKLTDEKKQQHYERILSGKNNRHIHSERRTNN